jgi:cobaltochelatase CobN
LHLLAAQPGEAADSQRAVDLDQSPGDIVVLSAADSELACLATARQGINTAGFPTLRVANLLQLGHPMSVDLYVDKTVAGARLVIVRLLGGRSYWSYGVEQTVATCREHGIPLALLPGDDQPDPDLDAASTVNGEARHRLWQYCVHGGPANARDLLCFAASLLGMDAPWQEPRPLLRAGLVWPGEGVSDLAAVRARWPGPRPVAALVFYRALVQAGNLEPVDALVRALLAAGLNPLPIFVTSLKDPVAAATVVAVFADAEPDIVVNATGFAASSGAGTAGIPFAEADCPVLQVIFAAGDEAAWAAGTRGLSPRDIAMNVALPEMDGRIVTRAVAFKSRRHRDPAVDAEIVALTPVADRVTFVAELAAAWVRLRRVPAAQRRVALVLANYPNRDGRLGNGVGLDTPASTIAVLAALAEAGYRVDGAPEDGNALVARLAAGPTNDIKALRRRRIEERLPLAEYRAFLAGLPDAVRERISGRWGSPEEDPFYVEDTGGGWFAVAAFRLGHVAVCLQPARGYNIDPASSYHDPDLPPPHGYLAFYAWLRRTFGAHAVVHMGKHGNLEWLPGKALALGATCLPEAALGPLPHLYPFIVNDPGEGTQAKRRTQAVIVDHLTPPLTRAESYGPLRDLEALVDEYYEASGVDRRRLRVLSQEILSMCRVSGLDVDCGIDADDGDGEALGKLDRYLCEIKEMQIRDGLHVFGRSPTGTALRDLLVALVRVPRAGDGASTSLLRALSDDLGLGFDPLDADLGTTWAGPRPPVLDGDGVWRTCGDTVERLERLAAALVGGDVAADPGWTRAAAVLGEVEARLRPAVAASGAAELSGLLAGLAGRFVPPGPSGAPTRGRPEVLPTGRNFFAIDTRTVPTPAAWTLGWASAALLLERHVQEHGAWPRSLALTAWGTSNMRTGGDDIAQAMALLGVRPRWEPSSRRVIGFEILPSGVLDRPRVDVTLRVSGFFRDAFPGLLDLFDAAVRAVAALDEPAADNPLAARVRSDTERLVASGLDGEAAAAAAGVRVFGSKPGAYGAGLQALIDERGWQSDADLARAYVAWGGYAYGGQHHGRPSHELFEARLADIDVVVQNQDNREHDLLDSDDYYQFEGGITAAVRVLSGRQPATYHADHARPERPRILTLEEEVARVVRARVVNPKWIAGVMRHGYKGGFEMAATVDYLFAFAATARCVKDHHFDAVFDAYVGDDRVRGFLADNNPAALQELSERLLEAQERDLWRPRSNRAREMLDRLAAGVDAGRR